MKILVASPTYKGMKYCMNEFLNSIRSLDYDKYDILIIDNSKDDEFYNELKKEKRIIVVKDDVKDENNMARLISSRNKILDYGLENNYDFILMMDCDVLPDKNIIAELLASNKDIVSGIYYNFFNTENGMEWLPVAWKNLSKEEFEEAIKQGFVFSDNIKSNEDIKRNLTEEEVASNELIEVFIPSAGCMLLSKNVFEKARYGILSEDELLGKTSSDDVYFIMNTRKLGFKAYCNTKVKCRHLVSGKYKEKEGGLIHPLYG